jgi:microsomal dipeptidase-like Zn-dependent dipeptidase
MYDERSEFYHWDPRKFKEWIDLVGADRTSIGSDLGQVNNPLPIDAFKKLLSGLHDLGVSERDLRKMVRDNPARLLGLN